MKTMLKFLYLCNPINSFKMKKLFITLLILLTARFAFASSVFIEGFEYANHEGETPVGWDVANNTWLCGKFEQDHNRKPHTGNWYAYTNSAESWMFMPQYMSAQLKYRFSLWAISDGGFQLEIWAGNEANPSAMTQLLLNEIVSSGSYEKFSAYIDQVATDYHYFGIHAVSSYGDYILSIDDIEVDMVEKYEITVDPANFYTHAAPGSQVEFNCTFTNLGYEPANVFITFITDYFSDVALYKDGEACTSFHAEPNESVYFTGVATFTPNINIGEMGWVDVFFTLDCDCATTMFTLWATADYEFIDEFNSEMSIYPNPSKGNVTIEGNGIVTISNVLGQEVLRKEIVEKENISLEKGIYFVKINDGLSQKVIIK